jgi:hypothetical protein
MTINLAATWNPRGETARLLTLLPLLAEAYAAIAIIFPPIAKDPPLAVLNQTELAAAGRLGVVVSPAWPQGRYLALQTALTMGAASHVHYADMDRLLRWVETRPAEWQATLRKLEHGEALVIGRTSAAYATHPQALVETEALSNRVVAHFLGHPMDVSAGSKGFSRRAVECLMAHAQAAFALGADAEWPILLHRSGFQLDYVEVDGLDWESADRYRANAADAQAQQQAAAAYDANPANWSHRLAVADEIIRVALETSQRPLPYE